MCKVYAVYDKYYMSIKSKEASKARAGKTKGRGVKGKEQRNRNESLRSKLGMSRNKK